jgi:hypothetical protein
MTDEAPLTAAQIAERFVGEPSNVNDLERAILRHMEYHMLRAAEVERARCAAEPDTAEVKRLRRALDMILATGDPEPNRPLEDCRTYARKALMDNSWPPA